MLFFFSLNFGRKTIDVAVILHPFCSCSFIRNQHLTSLSFSFSFNHAAMWIELPSASVCHRLTIYKSIFFSPRPPLADVLERYEEIFFHTPMMKYSTLFIDRTAQRLAFGILFFCCSSIIVGMNDRQRMFTTDIISVEDRHQFRVLFIASKTNSSTS